MSTMPGVSGVPAGGLARLHLRTGLLRLARVELEELAGEGRLDTDGILDLAEARWRTGDLRGAAEAAGAWLDAGVPAAASAAGAGADGRGCALAHAVIADGLTIRGRDDDAAAHVAAALDALATGSGGPTAAALDALFAGIPPRAESWPSFGTGAADAGPAEAVAADVYASRVVGPAADGVANDPIAAADERLRAGDEVAAAVLLVLALRVAPSHAGEVLQRADAALLEHPGAPLLLARAEALRALGRHEEAGIAYAVADARARGGAPDASPVGGAVALDPTDGRGTAPDAPTTPDRERSPR
jgi:hypothetical protein